MKSSFFMVLIFKDKCVRVTHVHVNHIFMCKFHMFMNLTLDVVESSILWDICTIIALYMLVCFIVTIKYHFKIMHHIKIKVCIVYCQRFCFMNIASMLFRIFLRTFFTKLAWRCIFMFIVSKGQDLELLKSDVWTEWFFYPNCLCKRQSQICLIYWFET